MGTRNILSKVYLISWYGPFLSVEEVEDWQRQNEDIDCRLYLVQGKKPHAKCYSYYCGQTVRAVFQRFKDGSHHIHEIPNRRNLWAGAFENRYNRNDINIAENMFIDLLSKRIKDQQCLNRQSLCFAPQERNMFFISKWHNPKRYQQPEYSLRFLLPEVVAYFTDTDEIKVAKKLRTI